ncbi:MAG: 2-hydroxyacid dehydrogenase [Clostridiales bacterium]|nr:2-hydroxyacid dehydrogenase [Clostridiales bacterium]
MKTIAITGPFNPATRQALHAAAPEGFDVIDVPDESAYGQLKNADYIIIRTIGLKKEDLQDASNMRLVQKWGAGYDRIDVRGIGELNIPVAICNGVNAEPVAEMAVMHMLALYRHFLAHNTKLRQNIWTKDEYSPKSYMLQGKTVGIIGLGNIGMRVARILKGFGVNEIYTDIVDKSELANSLGIQVTTREKLLQESDIVTIHVPMTKENYHMINREALHMMKPSAILINTARGGLVDDEALCEALRDGVIAGAGLDALPSEPPAPDWPLFQMENVVITPHTGGNTADNEANMIGRCMENILRIENRRPLRTRDLVNNEYLISKLETEDIL